MADNKDSKNTTMSYPDELNTAIESGFERVVTPFQEFIASQKTASVILIICTFVALLIGNSSLFHQYELILNSQIGLFFADASFSLSLHHFINDGLMAIFFFLLGLEIKRELVAGELQDTNKRILMFAAAAGGMVFPALIFYGINQSSPDTVIGWGIPMATDTAFAVGVLALLGNRVPKALYAFVVAFAIIDDLGAILVIAVFYTEQIIVEWLLLALVITLCLGSLNLLGIRKITPYLLLGLILWVAFLFSGIHATLAGILCALMIPARPRHGSLWLVNRIRTLIKRIDNKQIHEKPIIESQQQHVMVKSIEDAAQKVMTPLQRWEHKLDLPVALFIIPVFALANASIEVSLDSLSSVISQPLGLGILLGLVVGKPLGIFLLSWMVIKLKLGNLPHNMTMSHLLGLGMLGGMGFTMSIFISDLAFSNFPGLLYEAKLSIILASFIAGVSGYLILRFCSADFNKTAL
ncbi:MAG: NhaA family Na+:H+ antiporter [Oleispira sp.]|jgi:NhaA family Na+:H+ antiporter